MNDSFTFGKKAGEGRRAAPVRPSPVCGLSEEDAERSRALFGKNVLTKKKKRSFIADFFRNLSDPIIRILLFAMGINAALTFRNINWVEIGGIGATVLIATLVSTISEHSSSAAFEKLERETKTAEYTVIRGGKPVAVPSEEIVRYDLLVLSEGDVVPCDGIVTEGEAKVDQSSLTGESRPVAKAADGGATGRLLADGPDGGWDASDPFFLPSGSNVISGSCRMAVTAVGDATAYGVIASELQEKEEPSPLKTRLRKLAGTVSRFGYAAAVLVAAAYLLNSFVFGSGFDPAAIKEKLTDARFVMSELLHALTVAVSIVVVAVPEGLPMMITVVLSANMKKMMKNHVIVKKLVGIETAGNLSVLFTDKTGTVTTGDMAVESAVTAEGEARSAAEFRRTRAVYKLAAASSLSSPPGGGNATGRAVDRFVGAARPAGYRAVRRVPFDSARKYSAVLVRDAATGEETTLIRGAPEFILPRCGGALSADGSVVPMRGTPAAAGGGAVRVVALAYGPPGAVDALGDGVIPDGLVFCCLFRIRDEVRPEVREAAATCREAGVKVIMITGDGEATAVAVAQTAGLLGRKYAASPPPPGGDRGYPLVLSSGQIGRMTDGELAALLPGISVIYRVTPADKSRLVRAARQAGHVVGMTGDGVNDAPALKAADVGFAMGSGAEVAKEAGDVVISDDNFASVTRAILYGRTIFESIRKFITFQLTMNLCAVGVSIIGPLIGVMAPITIPQMLWINIIMDTLGSLAFAGEPPLSGYMKRPPRSRGAGILTKNTAKRIAVNGSVSLGVLIWFLASGAARARFGGGDETYRLTVFFALFVFFGITNALSARCDRINVLAGLFGNIPFVLIMGAVAAVQLLLIRFGGDVFRTVPISRGDLFLTAAISASVFPADFFTKTVLLRKRKSRA